MRFFSGTEKGQKAMADWGQMPSYIPYLEGPFQELTKPLFGDQKVGAVWFEMAMSMNTTFCRGPAEGALNGILNAGLPDVYYGDDDIVELLDAMADEGTEILPDYQV
jgi:hypothetical protein